MSSALPITPDDLSAFRRGGSDLLARLLPEDAAVLARSARRERFARGATLLHANVPAPSAFFIESGVASTVRPADGQRLTEICLVGPEGFVGISIVMGDGRSPYRTMVQTDELIAAVVDASVVDALFQRSAAFRTLLLGAVQAQFHQVAATLVTVMWQPVLAQLARWLLLFRERSRSDRLEITHDFIALMVGAQRSKITVTLHELEAAGAVAATRGVVIVRDAALLKQIAHGRS